MVAVFIRQSSNVTYLKTLLVALGRERCRKEAQEHEGRSNIIQIYRCTVVREFVPAQLQRNMPLHSTVTELRQSKLTAEHLQYSHPSIIVALCLFQLIAVSGCVPDGFKHS